MPVADEHFELSYDPQKVREVLRHRAAQRGTKVSQFAMPANTRIGNYVRQSEKRGTKVSQFAMPANTRIGNYVPQSEKRARYKTK